MASEDIAVAQKLWDAWQRGDAVGMFEMIDPEIVATQFPEQVDVSDYHGHQGVRDVMTDWIGTWDEYEIELLDLSEVGESVVAKLHQRGRGKGSGVAMAGDVWFVWRVRAGKVARWQMFSSESEALEAAG